jgi:rSAM/selenodomain-associated transferase 2/rSAM/selenodomain-associated transferase 1
MTVTPLVTVVIPVWRDEVALARALDHVSSSADVEIVVAYALGDDSCDAPLRASHPTVRWVAAPRGRGVQMNVGAAVARGRWLLFLHADSRLPPDWRDVIARADERPDVLAGSFRLALDSRDWRARVVERGVRLRVALFGLPYGDQGIFVRRRTFEAIGGYRDIPLMEDVDLVRRLSRAGRLYHARSAVTTSARRWERDGWWRRSAQNVMLASRFLVGATPSRLAQHYFGRKRRAIVMMARAPWAGGKTRLQAAADDTAHEGLRLALFLDTLEAVTSLADAEHIVACEPPEACERMRALVGARVDVIAQRGEDLGSRMAHVFEDVFRLGAESIVVIGSDLPDLPPAIVAGALAALDGDATDVVLGPAADGGYYLIGMNRLHPELFDGIDWSTERVMAQTVAAAEQSGVHPALLETWPDVDTAADLDRVASKTSAPARRTRAWWVEHRGPTLEHSIGGAEPGAHTCRHDGSACPIDVSK